MISTGTVFYLCNTGKSMLQLWTDSSELSVILIHQGCRLDPWSGPIQESTNECINKWNKKSVLCVCMCFSLSFPSSLSLKLKKKKLKAMARWLNWLEHRPVHQKSCGFDPQLGLIPTLWVWSLIRVCMESNWLMFLSHIYVFLSPPTFLSF